MKTIFTPLKIGKLEIANRAVMTAMECGLAKINGNPTSRLIDYYFARAKGGAGLITTGITRVDNWTGVGAPRQLSLANRFNIRGLRKLTKKIHETDTKIFAQLHHPGRQNFSALIYVWPLMMGCEAVIPGFAKLFGPLVRFYMGFLKLFRLAPAVVAPSAVPCQFLKTKTRALYLWEIKKLERKFIKAALRAQKAGFDGVEIHASHGYLIQQFISPRTNKRTDIYGGNFDNRYRFLKNIIDGIKKSCGSDFPLSVRLTVDEYYKEAGDEAGIKLDEGLKFAKAIEASGADVINVSSATYETMNQWLEPVTYAPGWRKNLAKSVKEVVKIPVIAANLIRSVNQAEDQLNEGYQDFIGLGRPFICDPNWVQKAKAGQSDAITTCINCLNCFETLNKNAWVGKPLECAVNPFIGYEIANETLPPIGLGKKAVVIGGGVAGLKSAEILAKQKYNVVLLEKAAKIGGQLFLAAAPPNKDRLFTVVTDLEYKCKELGVEFIVNTEAIAENVSLYKPDMIVLATGSLPFLPPIVGSNLSHVFSVNDVLTGKTNLQGKNVVVAGSGLTGLETAEYLACRGNQVTIIEMQEQIGPSAYHQNLSDVLERLAEYKTSYKTSVKLTEIKEDSILLTDTKSNKTEQLPCDAVVLSLGAQKNDYLLNDLKSICTDVVVVGDANKPGKISDAIKSAILALV